MKIYFNIDYRASWGQNIYVCGSVPELGDMDESKALLLTCTDASEWNGYIEIEDWHLELDYYYILKEGQVSVRHEWGSVRKIGLESGKTFYLYDSWIIKPSQNFLSTSAFTESFFSHRVVMPKKKVLKNSIRLQVFCPYVDINQVLILCGESDFLGNWNVEKASRLSPVGQQGMWELLIDADNVKERLQYKFAIYDKKKKQIAHWEEGENRYLLPLPEKGEQNVCIVSSFIYRHDSIRWRASGIAIPVFSLRSEDSFGIGEFSDLIKLIDWAVKTGQKVIQILPVNDTTITYKWTDSYPYNAISIYALHPVYLGLKEFPLKDTRVFNKYLKQAEKLNDLEFLDYERVVRMKQDYINLLFDDVGEEVQASDAYKAFLEDSEGWIFSYACFSYLRDHYQTADYNCWGRFAKYDKRALEMYLEENVEAQKAVNRVFFVQFLLHRQLQAVRSYAYSKGVVLKGDIPIGISGKSADSWAEPHLFNLDTQTGAPPDDFSINGQNWGFPTYNWTEMAKDGYQWWIGRFRKMSDYFDAYRIDHILGFFRIWEIPKHSVQGLLGYFNPALPYTDTEINSFGVVFDKNRMINASVKEEYLSELFGDNTDEAKNIYLNQVTSDRFELKEFCNTQQKICALFETKDNERSIRLRDSLYSLCNEVLFIKDKREPDKYHPRITAQYTFAYRELDDSQKDAFNRLYDNFFYYRHNDFWHAEAMKKLPVLISSNGMLVCGEDLGMIPACVPQVMADLQILSLEIERMPKAYGAKFEDLSSIPYMSVCSTSTHDMPPVRLWWNENRDDAQYYYNRVLHEQGEAPVECTPDICNKILTNHLNSPAMFTVIPLQDWMSVDAKVRNADAAAERINIPADPRHYWRYRMHITLEELLKLNSFNKKVRMMVESAGRD
ncbi:hypothetical protein D0T53_00580 [Dysgonomonas sp. 216]|uniref:4-alpha-glucanotransferase n=1 Tax=Dysgonomonas sp. 216 TaxID=2302934 RepID=UPI0013D2072D|nr:4-alpha-glucanotransferase [Dysgonomonas sp. 216]NDW17406.1 hypothetical protein [Dysgonomonas sp. 216]